MGEFQGAPSAPEKAKPAETTKARPAATTATPATRLEDLKASRPSDYSFNADEARGTRADPALVQKFLGELTGVSSDGRNLKLLVNPVGSRQPELSTSIELPLDAGGRALLSEIRSKTPLLKFKEDASLTGLTGLTGRLRTFAFGNARQAELERSLTTGNSPFTALAETGFPVEVTATPRGTPETVNGFQQLQHYDLNSIKFQKTPK